MIKCTINGIDLELYTEKTLFSPNGVDIGSRTMLSNVEFRSEEKVLDLGCGYGVVGIYAAHFSGAKNVTMVDINRIAVEISKKNAMLNGMDEVNVFQSDGFSSIEENEYDWILSNPPYHTDFKVAKHFIEKGFCHLKYGGRMVMVTKRYKWYKNKFEAVFGGVKVIEADGYYVFIAEKRNMQKRKVKEKKGMSKKLQKRHKKFQIL